MSDTLSPYTNSPGRPIFIGACPRSGTTLLRTMLNTHPDIAIPRETRFAPFAWEGRMRWRNLHRRAARERFARVVFEADWSRADRLATPVDVAVERMGDAPPTLGSLVGTCFLLYAEATGKSRWGDKRPMYARYLDMVFTFFPDAQYINVIRDPRAAVASMRKLKWFDGRIEPGLDLWARSMRAVEPWRKVLHRDQYLDIRYEDLVADPEAVLGQIADFLTLDRATISTMLTYHEHVDETAMRYHARLSEPVSAESVRSWESVLTDDEVALIEHVTADWMAGYGYQAVAAGRQPSRELRSSYRAHRLKMTRSRYKATYQELRRLVGYRRPIAAQLTSGQQDIKLPPPKPPIWQRSLGKPR